MRIMKTVLSVLIIVAVSLTMVAYGQYTLFEKRRGGMSPVHHISEQGRQFIIDEFGGYQDLPTLIDAIEKYEMAHFSYDYDYGMPLVQDFNFDEFLEKKTGVCWELAAFAKIVVSEVSALHGWGVSSYIVDVRLEDDFTTAHSYNYVIADNTIYVFDLTNTVVHGTPWHRQFDGDSLDDVYEYADEMNEKIYRVQ